MDYNSIHGPGISNFSSPSPHRMPTVSAAQALQNLKSSSTRCISTGIPLLDCALQNRESVTSDEDPFHGGVSRGKLTEIYGPPGVGKTALGMHLTASVLHAGEGVVWVDASHPLSGHRFAQILSSFSPTNPLSAGQDQPNLNTLLENLVHFSTPTLAHFIALFSQPTPTHPPANTSLIIIDSFFTLISCAFPRTVGSNATPKKPGAPNPSARRFAILQYIINSLQKLAATRNIAIVILSPCVTKMRPGAGAALVPAINTTAWEQGLACRLALFRDWGWDDEDGNTIQDVRLAQVIKAEGVLVPDVRLRIVGFSILESGLSPITLPITPLSASTFTSPTKNSLHPFSHAHTQSMQSTPQLPSLHPPQKRKFAETSLEIPDSEDDEDYGWAEEDEEELPPPPPQWQGSEDVLGPEIGPEEEPEEFEIDELAGDAAKVLNTRRKEIRDAELERLNSDIELGRWSGGPWDQMGWPKTLGEKNTVEPEDVLPDATPPPDDRHRSPTVLYGAKIAEEIRSGKRSAIVSDYDEDELAQ
ncbi:hypothetical protein EG329_006233 [Mollisiaceae sp. DMI_Dod_QoI]|nr:hypothetical protein EG329_006233 [Helotiales sp. DMI_Dod_QoI]